MPGIDASIPLGIKPPDSMASLSSLLGVANGMQTLQQNQQKTQQGGIDLQERQALQKVMSDPSNYSDDQGNFDLGKAQQNIMRVAPTTGPKHIQEIAAAHQQGITANRFLNAQTTEVRQQMGQQLLTMADSPPDVVAKGLEAFGKLYKAPDGVVQHAKDVYQSALQKGGQNGGKQAILGLVQATMPPLDQQTANTPSVLGVNRGDVSYGINTKPGIPNMPVGSVIPGTSVQNQPGPTQPTIGPQNQPGIMGGHGVPPEAGTVPAGMPVQPAPAAVIPPPMPGQPAPTPVRATFNRQAQSVAPNNSIGADTVRIMQGELAKEQAKGPNADPQAIAGLQREIARAQQGSGQGGFVPSGPVPGANESKGGTVQTMNQHWDNLNKTSENSQLLEGLLGNIKSLAPGAITGTESGRKAYVTGLLNSLHLGNQATGDMQKDTDLLEKNIAQLGLNTPASTDAMRTIVEAARPHSTMSKGAIEEAAAQLTGQLQANRALRNALSAPKQIADQTGDANTYQAVRQHMEEIADPRAWQFQALSPEGRKAMLSKLTPEDRANLRSKIEALHKQGLLQ